MADILHALNSHLPPECLHLSDEIRVQYSTDTSPEAPVLPLAVLTPTSEDQVGLIVALSSQYSTPIVIRGTGTGTTGGAIPVHNGLVLSFEKLNTILEIDTLNRVAVVQAGVLTGDLHKAVEAQQLFYPPDPASLSICTIGGNVAENAGGPRALKYGVTRDYVMGLEGFWANGTPFKLGGKHYKNVAGYDLIRLLVGSEGTLAIITRITLKLLPLPKFYQDLMISFDTISSAVHWLSSLHQEALVPATAELMDDRCVEAGEAYLGRAIPLPKAKAYVLVRLDSPYADSLERDRLLLTDRSKTLGACMVSVAQNRQEAQQWWELRQALSPALKHIGVEKVSHDIVVPPSEMGAFFEGLNHLREESGYLILGYGHLGDGNIHVNILREAHALLDWSLQKRSLSDQIMALAVQLGGTITGEHGIGLTKKLYLPLVFSNHDLEIMRGIKRVFDPQLLLNPGKGLP